MSASKITKDDDWHTEQPWAHCRTSKCAQQRLLDALVALPVNNEAEGSACGSHASIDRPSQQERWGSPWA